MSMDWKYKRSDFKRPPVQLEHADVTLKFYEDKIDGEITLHLFAREKVETVILDANAIDIKEVEVDSKNPSSPTTEKSGNFLSPFPLLSRRMKKLKSIVRQHLFPTTFTSKGSTRIRLLPLARNNT